MPTYVQSTNGTITDGPWTNNVDPGAPWVDVTGQPGVITVGSVWNGTAWVAPVIVPETVELWQAKVVLSTMPKAGNGPTLLDDANALAASVGGAVEIFWTQAQMVERDDPILAAMAAQLQITSAALDGIFIAAPSVKA